MKRCQKALRCDTSFRGELACLKVDARALELGALPSKPIVDGSPYDRIIDWKNKIYRVQVKNCNGKNRGGAVLVKLVRASRRKETLVYGKKEIDALLVYLVRLDKICWFGPDVFAGKTGIYIRLEPTKNNQTKGCIHYENYLW